jgi:hypothetical protein
MRPGVYFCQRFCTPHLVLIGTGHAPVLFNGTTDEMRRAYARSSGLALVRFKPDAALA